MRRSLTIERGIIASPEVAVKAIKSSSLKYRMIFNKGRPNSQAIAPNPSSTNRIEVR